ncbi:MAG: glycoside-pentoside-hexuronide (GPH):cation symporter [Oscillospiraceae bacterium]
MDEQRLQKRNMIMYPLGTVGRDMVYCLVTNFLLTYILFTKGLTSAQLGAVTAIMVAARVFDALNDPVMGNIIENTRSRWGKFKPWLLVGMVLTSFVVYMVFSTKLKGWSFIALFGVFYFSFSIAYTMHDISYWGMVPALGSDAGTRDQLTSRATLFAGIGGTLASILIPMLTTGESAIGGNASTAYSVIALAIGIIAPLFICFTLFGVREHREETPKKPFSLGLGKVVSTIRGNDQLLWISLIFLIQQVGNGLVVGGIGSTYIYLTFGYSGGLYSTFSTIGVVATAFLMMFYPAISRKIHRKKLMSIMMVVSTVGYVLMLISGFLLKGSGLSFPVLTVGNMLSNFGQYGFYLVMMISIINTVEYNEYKHGTREEAIIASIRPFFTKMGSALVVVITSVSYMIFGVTDYTNRISDLESAAASGLISEAEKLSGIEGVIAGIQGNQSGGLLLCMVVIPFVLMFISYLLYRKHYILDEEEYDRICRVIAERKQSV